MLGRVELDPEADEPEVAALVAALALEAAVVRTTVAEVLLKLALEAAELEEEEAEEEELEEAEEEDSPPEVMLNCSDWARIPVLCESVDMRLIWKAIPVGQEPPG